MTMFTSRFASVLQRALYNQQSYTETLANQQVRNGIALGFINLDAAGEALAKVSFPMTFGEKPVFTFGLELADNAYLVQGQFPLAAATVASWDTRREGNTDFYTGCLLGIVVVGGTGASCLHYCFQARSFTNPTGTYGGTGDIL